MQALLLKSKVNTDDCIVESIVDAHYLRAQRGVFESPVWHFPQLILPSVDNFCRYVVQRERHWESQAESFLHEIQLLLFEARISVGGISFGNLRRCW